jgi:hypothetical protein
MAGAAGAVAGGSWGAHGEILCKFAVIGWSAIGSSCADKRKARRVGVVGRPEIVAGAALGVINAARVGFAWALRCPRLDLRARGTQAMCTVRGWRLGVVLRIAR